MMVPKDMVLAGLRAGLIGIAEALRAFAKYGMQLWNHKG